MEKFVKLFESDKYGQLCFISRYNDGGDPIIDFYSQVIDADGEVGCAILGITFSTDSGRDKLFDEADLEHAESIAKEMKKAAQEAI